MSELGFEIQIDLGRGIALPPYFPGRSVQTKPHRRVLKRPPSLGATLQTRACWSRFVDIEADEAALHDAKFGLTLSYDGFLSTCLAEI